MFQKQRAMRARRAALRQAKTELDSLYEELMHANAVFDRISEPGELDACIFEISALFARYDAAHRRWKQRID